MSSTLSSPSSSLVVSASSQTKETDPLLVVVQAEAVPEDKDMEGQSLHEQFPSELTYATRLHQVVVTSLQLGLTAFGDTSLKIALIQDQVVEKGKWVSYQVFMELFAVSQAVPGPLATQCFMSAAMVHAGPLGALLALLFWALPGATLLTVIGILVQEYLDTNRILDIWLAGVAPATVALVLYASVNFARHLDKFSFALAMTSCFVSVFLDGDLQIANQDTKYAFPAMLVLGGLLAVVDALTLQIGDYSEVSGQAVQKISSRIHIPVWGGIMILQLWLTILLTAILLANLVYPDNDMIFVFSRFYRMGSVVFGGEETILPMMTSEMVPNWISQAHFSHGLALTQAAPGSIFNLAAYMGAIHAGSIGTALIAVSSIYVPSFLFLLAIIPIWNKMRQVLAFKALLKGVNAVSIGFMGAVCIFLWEGSIERASDAMILVVSLGLVSYYQVSAPLIIATAIILGLLLNEEGWNIAQKPYNTRDF